MPSKIKPLSLTQGAFLLIVALALACFYRLPYLDYRPMHVDEAILGWKSLELWKTGVFNYDPSDYHGPALHYLSWWMNAALSWNGEMTETRLRLVCSLCGLGVILVGLMMSDGLGRSATIISILLLAVSPMQVFYSRYYIMEMLLVLELAIFIAACWRYTQGKNGLWLLLAGVMMGAMHGTKETFVINMAAMLAGFIVVQIGVGGFTPRVTGSRLSLGSGGLGVSRPWLWVLVPAVATSVVLFSGLSHWDDVPESITTYLNYLQRSGGADGHEKPWYYYLQLLTWNQSGPLLWTEALIMGLALIGILHSLFGNFTKHEHQQALRVFLSVYAVSGLIGYSIIPYKTPWTILSIQWAFVLLAGVGAQTLYQTLRISFFSWLLHLGLLLGIYHLCVQTMPTIDLYRADPRNPYVYSHTSTQAVKLVERVKELQAFAPESFSAQVISKDEGWPLPWYFRTLERVGYQSALPQKLESPIIMIDSVLEEQLQPLLAGRSYQADYFGLRPGVPMTLLVEKSLWDAELAARTQRAQRREAAAAAATQEP
jgi:uncharacterized protein (TIGR03663 family)